MIFFILQFKALTHRAHLHKTTWQRSTDASARLPSTDIRCASQCKTQRWRRQWTTSCRAWERIECNLFIFLLQLTLGKDKQANLKQALIRAVKWQSDCIVLVDHTVLNVWMSAECVRACQTDTNRSTCITGVLYMETRRWQSSTSVNCDTNDINDAILSMPWSKPTHITSTDALSVFFVHSVVSTCSMYFLLLFDILVYSFDAYCDTPLAHLGRIKLNFAHQGKWRVASQMVLRQNCFSWHCFPVCAGQRVPLHRTS